MLAVITALARSLTLSAFGVYGLLISLPAYLLFAQGSVETVVIRALAQARSQLDRDRAFTTGVCVYAGLGLLAGLLIIFGGSALLGLFNITRSLHRQAELGLLALGLVNLVGWPAKTAQDLLRGSGKFVMAAATEALGYVTCGVLVLIALMLSAPLWVIVGLGGAISLMVGVWATVALFLTALPVRVSSATLSRSFTRSFLSSSLLLFAGGISDLVIYSLDRAILGIYRPVATIGLYEGPVRAHNLLRQLQGALVLTVMPAAATYLAEGDHLRLRELLLRGTRYVAIVMMPFTIVLMTLAGPILEVWLGRRFLPAAGAMTMLVSYWLLLGGSSVGMCMLIAAGRIRTLVSYSIAVAALNLALSLVLTPSLGLDGVVIGTSLPYVLAAPVFTIIVCRAFAVPVRDYLREGFAVPAIGGCLLASGELLTRALLPIERPAILTSSIVLGLGGYALGVYRLGMRPRERLLVRTMLTAAWQRLMLWRSQILLSGPLMPRGGD